MAFTSSSSRDVKGKAFEGTLQKPLLPSAYSSSSSMAYDVFLNHRGCDVKDGLAKEIFEVLNRLGLRVFLDKEVLEYGASVPIEIEAAMDSALLCIAIFSPKYAESSWCLDELSFMVKNNTKIIPIFYYVEPSDLRWVAEGKGVYVSSFLQHKKKRRCTSQKLEEWKTALYNVSFIYGQELKKEEDEGRVLKNIVNFVVKDMQIVPFVVAKHPVGLDEIVKDFENSAFNSSNREHQINIVGIVGMGGSGKTTLANELYNREFPHFDMHSFISDVRDAKSTLYKLQEQLLKDLSERFKSSIDNIENGKAILSRRLKSLRVLIVLDNVDHMDQIDALLPENGIFAAGSLIIVTTRDFKVLKNANISCTYKMKPLNASNAMQLFCWHAFMQSDPVQEFDDLVDKVMNVCKGLPLSLKVLGAQLYKESKDSWISQLDKISRILPEDIKGRLKISFDALDREQQDIFLDTACFFLGEKNNLAIEVWNGSGSGSGWSGLDGWETLVSKCLVELDQQNRICMHDHLRDMGREIAMERTPYRLFPSANLDICIQRLAQERTLIRGIMETSTYHSWGGPKPSLDYRPFFREYIELKPSSCGVQQDIEHKPSSCGLQLLVAAKIEFCEEYAMLSKELRWLRLFNFQHSYLPSWLSLENLRVLEIYDAPNLVELWQDNMQLSSLPSRFGDLTNLRHLNLMGCSNLKMLPDSFKQLKNLHYLDLKGCKNLTFKADILENTTKLEYLSFDGCHDLHVLPRHITKQVFLRELNLLGTSFSELPSSIGRLKSLEVLKIGSSKLESLPNSLGNLSNLTFLKFNRCSELKSLPNSLEICLA